MSYITAKDVSQWQGNWQDTGEAIVMIKMSGGDAGLYYDSKATQNYYGAKASGRAIGGYHFAGATDPVAEANFFVRAMSPLEEGDVLALDWEVQHADPVNWCLTFMQTVHDKVGIWPLIYMNLSTLNTYDWSSVLANCGLWLADWSITPEENASTHHTYVMHQYADGPSYDRDAWFGTLEQFKAYGYHSVSTPGSQPIPEPPVIVIPPVVIEPPAVPPPVPPTDQVVTPVTPEPEPLPTPVIPVSAKSSFWRRLIDFINRILDKLVGDDSRKG